MNDKARSTLVLALACWIAACGGATTTSSGSGGGAGAGGGSSTSSGGTGGGSSGGSGSAGRGPGGGGSANGGAGQFNGGGVTDPCVINSDCSSPLVCAQRLCHIACETTRDCPVGEHCIATDNPIHVCQLTAEARCTLNSDCPPPLLCAVDGQCRNQCISERDCLANQVCVSRTCAEPSEIVDGGLPGAR